MHKHRRATDLTAAAPVLISHPPTPTAYHNLAIYPLQVPPYPATPRLVRCTNKRGIRNCSIQQTVVGNTRIAHLQVPHTHLITYFFSNLPPFHSTTITHTATFYQEQFTPVIFHKSYHGIHVGGIGSLSWDFACSHSILFSTVLIPIFTTLYDREDFNYLKYSITATASVKIIM
jgi:hypothetical protein